MMKTQQPIRVEEGDEHRVLKFVPRSPVQRPQPVPEPTPSPRPHRHLRQADDFAPFEKRRETADDFQHRILANTAALALTVALIAAGIWLEMRISDLTKIQDCVVLGRRDCVRITTSQGSL
jgi:hypothetical protein